MSKEFYENEVVVMTPEEIEEAFVGNERQYLQGDLKDAQNLKFIKSSECEIGISWYDSYTHDEPHYHDYITETNYIISGCVCLRIVDTGEDFIVREGGVFSIPPHVVHVLKIQPGTKIIFTKTQCMNDKHAVDFGSLGLEAWFEDRDF